MSSLFQKVEQSLFPTPHFLKMPAAGIVIHRDCVRVVALEQKTQSVALRYADRVSLPEGAIVKGEVADMNAVQSALSQVKSRYGVMFANTALPEERAYLFQTTIPNLPERGGKLASMLEFKLEENVPIAPGDTVFDHELLNNGKRHVDHYDINVAAYPQEVVNSYMEAFNRAGISLLSLEVEPQAVARSLIPYNDAGTYMLIDIGHASTGVAIVQNRKIRFATSVDVAGVQFDQLYARAFTDNPGEVTDCSKYKRKYSIAEVKEKAPSVFEEMSQTLKRITQETNRYYAYWNSRTTEEGKRQSPIEKIILCGSSADVSGLPEYLSGNLKSPVRRGNPWTNLLSFDETIPSIDYEDSLGFASTIGLAMRDMF